MTGLDICVPLLLLLHPCISMIPTLPPSTPAGYFSILLTLNYNQLNMLYFTGMLKCVLGWCLPKDYQKLESPTPDSPVHVDINVEILDILSVNDKEFSISMSMYFSVMWQESRIWTNNSIEPGMWYPVSLEFLNDLWIPNVFIYNLKSFSSLQVLKRLAGDWPFLQFYIEDKLNCILGVWIIDGKDVFYNQFAQVTFLCPMRFERYPLDEHICKFRVGSTNMDINYMRFGETTVTYDESSRNTILDYQVEAKQLRETDRIYLYQGTNYSVTGNEGKPL